MWRRTWRLVRTVRVCVLRSSRTSASRAAAAARRLGAGAGVAYTVGSASPARYAVLAVYDLH